MKMLGGIFFMLLFYAGCSLLYHLGAGTIPSMLKPLVNMWVKEGDEAKGVNIALWLLFILVAGALLLYLVAPMYSVILDMGRGFK
ncbi:MAG TPA: hypothetical protein VGO91_07795 [Pyrinomonadaceae bacterium]|jgi:hypothetical protein|nr:hypothetical protein [Pyrinomonadaceae bacterium]